MEKLSNSDLQVLVDTLIDKLNKDNFKPNIIVAASESVDHLASKLSQYFSVGYTHIKGGHRANSNNILLQYAYSILRKIKKGFFRNIDSGDNHLLRISRKLVMEIYKRTDPCYVDENNSSSNKIFKKYGLESSILIVDDNVFTGKTLECVTRFLVGKGFNKEKMRKATITAPYQYKPDYYASEKELSFPWNPVGI